MLVESCEILRCVAKDYLELMWDLLVKVLQAECYGRDRLDSHVYCMQLLNIWKLKLLNQP